MAAAGREILPNIVLYQNVFVIEQTTNSVGVALRLSLLPASRYRIALSCPVTSLRSLLLWTTSLCAAVPMGYHSGCVRTGPVVYGRQHGRRRRVGDWLLMFLMTSGNEGRIPAHVSTWWIAMETPGENPLEKKPRSTVVETCVESTDRLC